MLDQHPDQHADQQPDRARVRVTRAISADPTSTALLLAGPTAMDLWPGLRRVGEAEGRVLVEAELNQGEMATFGAVRALPPRRTPTAYVTRFETTGPDLPRAQGTLTLGYDQDDEGVSATVARFEVDVEGLEASGLSEPSLRALVRGFLDNLAEAAESRSDAA